MRHILLNAEDAILSPDIDMKRVPLIALDYAQSFALDRRVRSLAKANRISGISVVASSDLWPREAQMIKDEVMSDPACRARVGLSIDLSPGAKTLSAEAQKIFGSRLPSALFLALQCRLSKVARAALHMEIKSHIGLFTRKLFYDPHFMVIDTPLCGNKWFAEILGDLREDFDTTLPTLYLQGAKRTLHLRKQLTDAGWKMPPQILRLQRRDKEEEILKDFDRIVRDCKSETVIFCRPGDVDERLKEMDPEYWKREIIANFLAHQQIDQILRQRDVFIF